MPKCLLLVLTLAVVSAAKSGLANVAGGGTGRGPAGER